MWQCCTGDRLHRRRTRCSRQISSELLCRRRFIDSVELIWLDERPGGCARPFDGATDHSMRRE